MGFVKLMVAAVLFAFGLISVSVWAQGSNSSRARIAEAKAACEKAVFEKITSFELKNHPQAGELTLVQAGSRHILRYPESASGADGGYLIVHVESPETKYPYRYKVGFSCQDTVPTIKGISLEATSTPKNRRLSDDACLYKVIEMISELSGSRAALAPAPKEWSSDKTQAFALQLENGLGQKVVIRNGCVVQTLQF